MVMDREAGIMITNPGKYRISGITHNEVEHCLMIANSSLKKMGN